MNQTTPPVVAQGLILIAVLIGWLFSLVQFEVYGTVQAEAIAYGGWAALLALIQLDFGAVRSRPGVTAPTGSVQHITVGP